MALAVLLGSTGTAHAATLRATVTLHGTTVKLSDLFDGLQPGQDCDIGPAPAPGKRLIVPASQVMAIASQFGVDLPGTSARSLLIERPARTVRRDEVIAALKPALIAAGMPADSDINLGVLANLAVAADNTAAASVAALDFDVGSGRFSASLQFAAPDEETQTVRVTGRTDQMVPALTLLHVTPAGSAVTPADIASTRIRKTALRGTPATDPSQFSGLVSRQPLAAGTVLTQEQFLRPMLVTRGRSVVLRLTSGGLALTAAGTALEAGGDGDRIHVMNSTTRAILLGTVAGLSDVVIDPGTAPVFATTPGGSGAGQLPRLVADSTPPSLPPYSSTAQEAR